jgi:hypothetical protein
MFGKKKEPKKEDVKTENRRLKAENDNLRIQLQQQWEIIYKYERDDAERKERRRKGTRRRRGGGGVFRNNEGKMEDMDARIKELQEDNHVLAKYLLTTRK